jgi:hypothetical protein
MARVELLVIDQATDIESFAKEVRWNALSFKLG